MELDTLFSRFEIEFEVEFADDAVDTLVTVKAVRDYIRREIMRQGVECSAGVVFDRMCQLIALVLRVDAMAIRPETRLADLLPKRQSAA